VREVNERIEDLDREAEEGGATPEGLTYGFHCECGREGGCDKMVWMTLAEYEIVREQDDRFTLAPGHEDDELEDVVTQNERFVIVDKIAVVEPQVADDPRGRGSH